MTGFKFLKEDISLQELAERQLLSVRAESVCKNAGLFSLKDIFRFYEKNGSFMMLKSCGKKTNLQLTDLCERYKSEGFTIKITEETEDKDVYSLVSTLSFSERQMLNQFIETLVSGLSTRARRVLTKLYPSGNPTEIIEVIYKPGFDFRQLKNIGVKSADELEIFNNKVSGFIKRLAELSETK